MSTLMSRRRALRLLAVGGLSVGGLAAVVGCGSSSGSHGGRTDRGRHGHHGGRGDRGSRRRRDPGGDRRAVPGRRLQRRQRPHRERHRAPGHHHRASASASGVGGGRAAHDRDDDPRHRPGRRRRRPGPPSTSGTATARAGTRSTTAEIADENYLRGVQEADADGARDASRSIFPAAYSGRWPHIHFEVYPSLDRGDRRGREARHLADRPARRTRASRCTRPPATSRASTNLAQTSLATDMVFSDGYSTQLGTVTGSVPEGMTVRLNVGV